MLKRSQLRNKNSFSAGGSQGRKNFILVCLVSLLVHGLFFAGIVLLTDFNMSKPVPRVIRVDLVSFVPGPAGGQDDPDAQERNKPPVKESVDIPSESVKVALDAAKKPMAESVQKIAKPIASLKPDISLKTKPKNLKALMAAQEKKQKKKKKRPAKKPPKPKPDPEETLKKAREQLAKKIEEQNQKKISDALNRIQAAIKAQGDENNTKPTQTDVSSQGAAFGAGDGTGLGKQGSSPLDLYKSALGFAIKQKWVFNDRLARMDNRLQVMVMIKILKNGEIRDIAYETKSGNRYLDESAKKAIKRANPLPKLPQGMNSYDIVVTFTPKGLK